MFDEGELAIRDDRVCPWGPGRESQLIESFLCKLPVPQVVIRELDDGRCRVVDGNSRCVALHRYARGGLRLRGLELLPELEGTTFADLDGAERRKFLNRTVKVFLVTRIPDGWLNVLEARLNEKN